VKISKRFTFDAAHRLPDWPEIHGHSYEVEVWFEGPVVDGYVIRESELTAATDAVRRELDHRFLNDVMDVPTSENIARWLWARFAAVGRVVKVRVYRGTVGLAVEYEGD
jgi:6-pyruvoyltetrahydropterin/6-carboxytetrahydropterin synthase